VGLAGSWLGGVVLGIGLASGLGLFAMSTRQRADSLETHSHVDFLDRLHLPVFGVQVGTNQVAVDVSGVLGRPRIVSPPLVPAERGLGGVLDGFLSAAGSLPPFLDRDEALDVPLDLEDLSGPSATLLGLEARFAELAEQLDAGFAALRAPSYELPVVAADDDALPLIREHAHSGDMPGEWHVRTHVPSTVVAQVLSSSTAVAAVEDHQGTANLVDRARHGLGEVAHQFDVVRSGSFETSIFEHLDMLDTSGSLAAFNFYCPTCNAEQMARITSRSYDHAAEGVDERIDLNREARLFLEPASGRWTCQLCSGITRSPIPVHRAMDEALLPAFDALTRQFHSERLAVYSDIYNQKLRYRQEAEQQLDELRRVNRAEVDQTMQQMRALAAEVGEGEAAMARIAQLMRSYESLQEGRLGEIAQRAEGFQTEIERSHAQFVQEYRETVRDELTKIKSEIEHYAQLEHRDQKLRDEVAKANLAANERSAAANERSADANEKSAAVAAAQAKRMGMDDKSWLVDPFGAVGRGVDSMAIGVGLKSELDVGKEKKV